MVHTSHILLPYIAAHLKLAVIPQLPHEQVAWVFEFKLLVDTACTTNPFAAACKPQQPLHVIRKRFVAAV
jgi:hypothetical protein